MPEARPPKPRASHRFAALGVVGAVMVLLPTAQLLRYQHAEIEALQTYRAALNPMAEAVGVQRQLLAHAGLAAPVLAGQLHLETRRHERQTEVDRAVDSLQRGLNAGGWFAALEEARSLGSDWAALAREVSARSIGPMQSDLSHRLRIEQALQVMDLLDLALTPDAPLAAVMSMPRVAQQWSSLTPDADPAVLRAAGARLQQMLAGVDTALAQRADPALATAAAQLRRQTEALLQALPARGEAAAAVPALRQAAVQAQFELLTLAHGHATAAAQARVTEARWRQAGTLALLLILTGLAWRLWQDLRRAALPQPAATAPGRAESGLVAGRLMQRLRSVDTTPSRAESTGAATPRPPRSAAQDLDAQPTLPPPT